MKKDFFKNIIVSFGGQLVILVMGFVVPRILIVSYGSDVNGLLSTITQIFTYLALLEAGIGQAAKNLLYKPVAENNEKDISSILTVARGDFQRITVLYAVAVLVLSIVFPWIVHSNVAKWTIFWTFFIEGLSGVCSFSFLETDRIFLSVNGKSYINNYVDTSYKILSCVIRIILAWQGVSIIFLQVAFLVLTILKIIFYRIYYRKNYSWIDYKAKTNGIRLSDRNAFVLNEVAWTVFSSTDMIVISSILSTSISSVYAVYSLVFSSINTLLHAVYSAVVYLLGRTYHQDLQSYIRLHDAFQSVFIGAMTALMCVSYWLILPFVSFYTKGIGDVNYIMESLPIMFCLINLLSWTRYVPGNLTSLAGYAKIVSKISLIEAAINLSLSIILARRYGVTGILFATVAALPLKCVVTIFISERLVMKRSCRKTICILATNYAIFVGTVIISQGVSLSVTGWGQFIVYGIILTSIYCVIGFLLNLLANNEILLMIRISLTSGIKRGKNAGN